MTELMTMADIARLAHVQRPVVTMWAKREASGIPFPSRQPAGGFLASDVLDYLEKTGRGKNREARTEIALVSALAPTMSPDRLPSLRTLVALREFLGRPLADCDPDDLVDFADELDPDDEWLLTEVTEADDLLAADADAIAEAAWGGSAAVERLHAELARRGGADELGPALVELLAGVASALLDPGGCLVDVGGTCTDVVLAVARERAERDGSHVPVVLAGESRTSRLRYAVAQVSVRTASLDDDWALPAGSVALLQVPGTVEAALDLIDQVALQLGPHVRLLVTGPASVLVDDLSSECVGRRDAFLRARQVGAIVRLPGGLDRAESRRLWGLWAMTSDAGEQAWVGDLAGRSFEPALRAALLDDLLATLAGERRLRAFAVLRGVRVSDLLAARGGLVRPGTVFTQDVRPSAADDAVRLDEELAALASEMTDHCAGLSVQVHGEAEPRSVALGDASQRGWVRVVSGHRLQQLPAGSTRLWTVDAVAFGQAASVDLVALTSQHPGVSLTRPGDVIFTGGGRPRATLDALGGSVVAYPARVIRVESPRLSPRAVAATINALPEEAGVWRGWMMPVVTTNVAAVEDVLARLDAWDDDLRARLDRVAQARRLFLRSGLCGAISLEERTV